MRAEHGYTTVYSYREQLARSVSWGHHFLFLNLPLTCFIGSVYLYAAPPTHSFNAFFYLTVTWLGHLSFLTCVLYLIPLFPLAFIGRFHLYRYLAAGIMLCADTLLLFDAKLYLSTKAHVTLSILSLLTRDLDFNTGLNYNFLWIAVPVLVGLQFFIAKAATARLYGHTPRHLYQGAALLLALCFVTSHCLHIWYDARNDYRLTALRTVFPLHYPMTARSFLSAHGWVDERRFNARPDQSLPAVTYPLERMEAVLPPASRDVLMLFVNGLSYGDLNPDDTPELLALKRRGRSYEHHYLLYPQMRDNLFAVSYGVPARYRDAFASRQIYPVCMDELHRREYAVRLITSALPELSADDLPPLTGSMFPTAERLSDDDAVARRARELLAGLAPGRNFCFNVFLNGPARGTPASRAARIRRCDALIGGLIGYLEASGRLGHTVVIITSAAGHAPAADAPAAGFDRETAHVPLIVLWPGAGDPPPGSESRLTTLYDFAPTVGREVLGFVNDSNTYSLGYSLGAVPDRDFAVTAREGDVVLINPDWVTVYRPDGSAFCDNYDRPLPVTPNLVNLIKAVRELNRFAD